MKRIIAILILLLFTLLSCVQPNDDNNNTTRLPKLIIRNQSSYILTDVMYSGFSFSTTGIKDLLINTSSSNQLTEDDVNKAGVITFTRKDIGIKCKTEAIFIEDTDFTFTFHDNLMVEEQANSNNQAKLSQITLPPRAAIFNGNTEIPQNGIFNIGDVLITQKKSITVIIKNTGVETLTINTAEITITGNNANVFSKITSPGNSVIGRKDTQFTIDYEPVVEGINSATLTIPTNDSTRSPVVVILQATAVKGSGILTLSQGSANIVNNSVTPFDFGVVDIETNKDIIFTIKNTGNISLELTGEPIVETSNSVFSIQTQPANKIININGTGSFIIRYDPTEEKEDTGTISIINDSDGQIFTFRVKGNGYEKKPQIYVRQGTTNINIHGEFNFGTVAVGETKDIIFTVGNSGDANLIFEDNINKVNISGSDSAFFNITQPATSAVTPGNTTAFTISYTPNAVGDGLTATIKILTNSRNNKEYLYAVKGSSYVNTAPSNVTASTQSSSSIRISWNSVSEVSTYRIYRSTTSTGTYTQVGTSTATSYSNTGLSPSTAYYYKISTVTSAGNESVQSAYVSATTPAVPIPTNVAATAQSSSNINVAWTSVTEASSYRIYRSATATGTYTQIGTSTATSYSNIGLTPSTTYYYKVSTVNSAGFESEQSSYVSAATPAIPVPASVSASASSSYSINISWARVTEASSYRIYRSATATGTYSLIDTTSSTSYSNSNLTPNTAYYYKVSTVISSGSESAQSAYVTATTQQVPLLQPPSMGNAIPVSGGIRVWWEEVSGAQGYTIYRSASENGTYSVIATNVKGFNYFYSTTGSTTHYFKIATVNSAGVTGSQSAVLAWCLGPDEIASLPYYSNGDYGKVSITDAGLKYYSITVNSNRCLEWADAYTGPAFSPALTGAIYVNVHDAATGTPLILFDNSGWANITGIGTIIVEIYGYQSGTFCIRYY